MPLCCLLLVLAYTLGSHLRRTSSGPAPERWWVSALVVWSGFALCVSWLNVSRIHQQRQSWLHDECDSIAHVYRLLQTLPRNERAQMRLLLLSYLDANLRNRDAGGAAPGAEEESLAIHSQLYALTTRLVKAKTIGDFQGAILTQALSRMISVHHRTSYALHERLSGVELGYVLFLSLLGAGLVGYARVPRAGWLSLLVIIGASLSLVLDLNNPWSGWIRVDRKNLQELSTLLHQKEKL